MNNEPVAYIDPYDLERLPHYDCHIGSQQLKNGIPLYTHPVKELTDEEIQDLMVRSGFIMHDFYSVKIFVESVLRRLQND